MSNQYEYEWFWVKFLQNAQDIQNEFNKLSEENKIQVVHCLNRILQGYGYAVVAEDILRKCMR